MDKIILLFFGSTAILFAPQCASQSIGTEKACNTSSWPDLDHGLVCGDCKALIKNMKSEYITCDSYCNKIGKNCTGAWEESDDTCNVETIKTCDHKFDYTSDAICECRDCCETLTISSTGGTAEHQGHRLGTYKRDGEYNQKPVYKQQQGTNVLFFSGYRWRIGSSFNSGGGFMSKESKPGQAPVCPSDVKEWVFYDSDTTNTVRVDSTATVDCEAIDGGWSDFEPCPKTCKGGVKTRTCTNPAPQYGGKPCTGNDSLPCNQNINCSIDGGWSDFGRCTKTCKGGVMTRTCTNPDPQYGGKPCTGNDSLPCNQNINCYKAYNLTSRGEARTKFPQLMGVYKLSVELHNNFPVYKQDGGPGLAHVDQYWVVGEEYGRALLYSSKHPITPSPPESQWYFYHIGNLEWDGTDSTLLMLPIDPEGPTTEDTCCETLIISSSGGAAYYQGGRLGTYKKDGKYNNKPLYKQQQGTNKLIFGEVEGSNRWVIGSNNSGGLISKAGESFDCPSDVKNWVFPEYGYKILLVDSTATVNCGIGLESVNISSIGDGGVHRQEIMGTYIRTSQKVQGHPVYRQKLKKSYQRNYLFVDPKGNWRVGPNITTWKGSTLKNKHRSSSPPQGGWQYYKKKEGWINEDYIQAVQGFEEISNTCPETDVTTQGREQLGNSIEVDTWMDCAKLCDINSNCTYWTWVHELSNLYAKNCDLMSSFSRKVYDGDTISGPKTCQGAKHENMFRITEARAAISMIVSFFILTVLIIIIIYYKRKVKKISKNVPSSERGPDELEGNIALMNDDIALSSQANLLPFARKFELSREDFSTKHMIGDGQFGMVFIGSAKNIYGSEQTEVAIKQVKNMFDDSHFSTIIGELKILSNLDMHMNLVNLLAACTANIAQKEIYLILELCKYGDLKNFLNKNRQDFLSSINYVCTNTENSDQKLGPHLLLNWTYCIAKGMQYLSSKNIMHGDLAARNILLDENYVAKISDFGLSKEICYGQDYQKVNRRMIPWAWMALEYLQTGMFNLKSDVWSYGIVLWEIFSLGNKPYCPESYEDVKKKLVGGYHLPAPDHMNELDGGKDLYRIIMEPCWSIQPKKRPSFTEITDQLRNALDGKDLEEYQMFEEKYAERKKLFNSKFSKMETAKGEYITVGDQKNEKKNDPETDAHGYIITK